MCERTHIHTHKNEKRTKEVHTYTPKYTSKLKKKKNRVKNAECKCNAWESRRQLTGVTRMCVCVCGGRQLKSWRLKDKNSQKRKSNGKKYEVAK